MKLMIIPLLTLLALTGCATPPAIDSKSLPPTPEMYKARFDVAEGHWTVAPPADTSLRGEWWTLFHDDVLAQLEQQVRLNNTDLQSAAARLAQARALVRNTEADQSVQMSLNAGAARGTPTGSGPSGTSLLNSSSTPPMKLGSVGTSFSYELDLVGRLSQSSRAAMLDSQASEALLQSTLLLVQANVAQTYFDLRFADQEQQLLSDTLTSYQQTATLVQQRYEAGEVGELDVVRLREQVAATEAELFSLQRQRSELENALAVLVGQMPSGFRIARQPFNVALPVIPAGVPSTMLARRPDIAAAQRSLMAAQARVGVAQTAWFPSLSLTSAAGFASSDLGEIFRWSARAWSVEALLSLPVLDGGRRQAGVESAKAGMGLALAGYRQHILQAMQEVEDALTGLQTLSEQAAAQTRAVTYATRATHLAATRYREGMVSQLELLDAQRTQWQVERQALQVNALRFQRTVMMVRALGGGWEVRQS